LAGEKVERESRRNHRQQARSRKHNLQAKLKSINAVSSEGRKKTRQTLKKLICLVGSGASPLLPLLLQGCNLQLTGRPKY